jgi:hypothetical protein
VIVPGKYDVHSVLDKQRFDQRPQLNRGAMRFSRRIEWMMKETYLPIAGSRILQLLLQPRQLFGVHVIAVEREKAHVAFLEAVVVRSVHVKKLVETLVRIIVIA